MAHSKRKKFNIPARHWIFKIQSLEQTSYSQSAVNPNPTTQANAPKRASPATTTAPNFEKDILFEAFETFEVEAGCVEEF